MAEHLQKGDMRTLRIHQAIAQKLGTAILAGEYQPGDALSGEIEQSLALGVSRTPYREAIRILVAKGLLESRPKAGTHVTPRERWNLLDPDILAWTFASKPDESFVRDLFELRNLLEPAAAELASTRHNPEQIETMRSALVEMRAHGLRTEAGQAADQQFHRALLAAAGNRALASLSSSVGAAVRWTTHYKQRAHRTPRDAVPDHEAVFDQIAAGNGPGAADAMRNLLDLAYADMAAVLEQSA